MVVFLMPSWSAPSELWMQRMIGAISDQLIAIGCYEAPVDEHACGVPVINLGRRGDEVSIEQGKGELLAILKAFPGAAVLCHYLPFAMRYADVWAKVKNPLFVHGHGYDLAPDLVREGKRFHSESYAGDVVELSKRAVILANSEQSAEKVRGMGVDANRVVVKYLGVAVGEYCPPVLGEGLDCLFLGRLVDFKGPVETLRAFEGACGRGMKGRLTFAGDGPLMGRLKAAVVESSVRDRVSVLGMVSAEEGEELRRTHHAFVSHSQVGPESGQEEALGVAYLEAMASGMPIVSARGGSLTEVVEEGKSGLLCDTGDVGGQAGLLAGLSSDRVLWKVLSRGAWAAARDRFSIERERRQLLHILCHDKDFQ